MFHRPRNNNIQQRRAQCQHTHRRCLQARLHRAGRVATVRRVLMQPEALRKAASLTHSASCRPMRTLMTRRVSTRSRAAIIETTASTQRLSLSFREGQCHQLIRLNLHSPPQALITVVLRLAHHIWRTLATNRQCHRRLTDPVTAWLGKDLTHHCLPSTALSNTHPLTHFLAPQCKARHHIRLLLRTADPMVSTGRVIRRTVISPRMATRQASPRNQQLEFRRYKPRKWKHEACPISEKSMVSSAYMVWIIITLALSGYGKDGHREKTKWMLPGFRQIYHRDDKKHHINVYTQIKTVS